LHLSADVHEALLVIVHKVGEVEVSEQNALAIHARAVAAKVYVVREKACPRHESR
jgi:hypothetical protein